MSIFSDNDLTKVARGAGFTGNGLVMAVAIALAESGGENNATGYNRDSQGHILSVDRGLWQINSAYHSEVSAACAYNPGCSAQQAYRISNQGGSWVQWSTFTNGRYRSFLSRAQAAVSATSGIPTAPSPPSQGSDSPTGSTTNQPVAQVQNLQVSDVLSNQTNVLGHGDPLTPYKYLLALGIMFSFLYVVARTSRAGYCAVYYGQVLILLFLFATQADFFKNALLPLTKPFQPQGDAGGTSNSGSPWRAL